MTNPDWDYTTMRAELALALLRDGAFLTRDSNHPFVVTRPSGEKGFKLQLHDKNPDAPLSPYYFNIRVSDNPTRPGTVTPETVKIAAECMYLQALTKGGLSCKYVVGIPNAGDPFAKDFSTFACIPFLKLIKDEVDGKRIITGLNGLVPPEGSEVDVLDDLITAAGSKFLGINPLRDRYKLVVKNVRVIIDREQGGGIELAKHDITLHSLFTTTELVNLFRKLGAITPKLHAYILQYIADQARG